MEFPAAPIVDAKLRRRLHQHIDRLPVLPTAVAQLMSLDPEADDFFEQVLALVEAEPNFAARLLTTANSAASSPIDPIVSLPVAIARIGSERASDLVLAMAVTRVFVPRDDWEKALWRHGVQVAHATRGLARLLGDPQIDPDEAYATGLLHDVGRFVLFQEAPDGLREVDEGHWDTPASMLERERSICGLLHTEVGALACRHWGLPDLVVWVAAHHHDQLPAVLEAPGPKLAAMVRLADFAMFPSALPGRPCLAETHDDEAFADLLGPKVPSFLRLSIPDMRQIIGDSLAKAETTCALLGL